MNNQLELDRSFLALSHPVRRGIVERLVSGPTTVGQASAGLGVSKPAVTKHLKVLEGAGVVSRTVTGRTHLLRVEPRALREASDWLELHRSLWEAKFEAVEEYLATANEGQEFPNDRDRTGARTRARAPLRGSPRARLRRMDEP